MKLFHTGTDDNTVARLETEAQLLGGLTHPGLLRVFDVCIDKVMEAVRAIPADKLDGPPTMPGPFATSFGEGVQFGSLHVVMHSGQLSTVRRGLGKPPVV